MKTALVLGAGGFIGSHLVRKLKEEGYHVTDIDLKYPEFSETLADQFWIGDLRDIHVVQNVMNNYREPIDEVYQLAAMMGVLDLFLLGSMMLM